MNNLERKINFPVNHDRLTRVLNGLSNNELKHIIALTRAHNGAGYGLYGIKIHMDITTNYKSTLKYIYTEGSEGFCDGYEVLPGKYTLHIPIKNMEATRGRNFETVDIVIS